MKSIAQLIVRVTDLVEAEGRVLRVVMLRLGLGAALGVVAALMCLIGLCLVLVAAYTALEAATSAPVAALVTGLASLLVGGALIWTIARINR
ncbi:MAG TPA: hypothetical protein VD963_10980 [Phycisphaerales bacterium]|nr:hypothetical protein [Phycisphaerales bacterium]